jgi:hypothetical protein
MLKKIVFVFSFLVLVLVLASCGTSTPIPINLTGIWSMDVTNNANDYKKGTFTLNLSQIGSSVSGSAYVSGAYAGSISGSNNDGSFSFTLATTAGSMNIKGKTTSLNYFYGDYTASAGGYGPVSGTRNTSSSLQSQTANNSTEDIASLFQAE